MQPILRLVGASTALVPLPLVLSGRQSQTFGCHLPGSLVSPPMRPWLQLSSIHNKKLKLDTYKLHMKYRIPSPRVSSPTRQSLQSTPTHLDNKKLDIDQLRRQYRIPDPPFRGYSRQGKWDVFERWMKVFNKVYANEEEKMMRFEIFSHTMERLNKDPSVTRPNEHRGCEVGLNKYSDAASADEVHVFRGLVRYERKADPRTGLKSQTWEPIVDQFGNKILF